MKTKKIWIGAIIFGILTTSVLYFVLFSSPSGQTAETEKKVEQSENKTGTDDAETTEGTVEEQQPPLLPLSEGKRAISIQVNATSGVAGNIKPGSHVDVVTIMIPPSEEKKGRPPEQELHDAATLLLQDVRVLGIGHAADAPEAKARYEIVTLEVDPYEGLALGLATKYELYLLLRNEEDETTEPVKTNVNEVELHKGVFR